ncbi:hypothetical protein F5972_35910 [Microbispora cellulosiformans]|uniref:Aminoacyl-transfer RNA synthetases class-II family profile domain-containing protein n=1 Tax=Microbispora cellulosiformans TaxID=2614688 RepID=A0A5J5JTK9_9ACTN|nr:hypothetical protein [Microbispora cellulosiformans]KAA9373311.1 hypothetical protein F5972_35910 [Microbispora cellulosiformans]
MALDEALPAEREEDLRSRVFFVDEAINDFSLSVGDEGISEVTLVTGTPVDESELGRKLRRLVEGQLRDMRTVPAGQVWRSSHPAHPRPDVFEELVESGAVAELGEGQFCLDQGFLTLMDYLDGRLREIVRRRLSGREYRYPTLLSVDTLRRAGYLSSFPQFLMFVTRLHGDVDTYSAFLNEERESADGVRDPLRFCDNSDYCLPPTMCFHTYHQWSGKAVPSMVVTARGKSFRFESRYRRSLERLWDFTIREVVFLGDRDHVLTCRETLMNKVFELLTELGMAGTCELANDLFFSGSETSPQTISQRMLALKYELRLPVASDRTVAAGSFNFHERLFTDSFDIRHVDGIPAYTGCAGFGLERLAYAFLCQHGVAPKGWPRPVREHHERARV